MSEFVSNRKCLWLAKDLPAKQGGRAIQYAMLIKSDQVNWSELLCAVLHSGRRLSNIATVLLASGAGSRFR